MKIFGLKTVYRIKMQVKTIKLARYGGLSPVKQKHYTTNYDKMTYHGAPERYGFYSFLWPYIDWFLLGGTNKVKESYDETITKRQQLLVPYKKFSVSGYIWTHLDCKDKTIDTRGSWNKVLSTDFIDIFNREFSDTIGEYNKLKISWGSEINHTTKSPFRHFTKDHLEIFVPKGTKIIS